MENAFQVDELAFAKAWGYNRAGFRCTSNVGISGACAGQRDLSTWGEMGMKTAIRSWGDLYTTLRVLNLVEGEADNSTFRRKRQN